MSQRIVKSATGPNACSTQPSARATCVRCHLPALLPKVQRVHKHPHESQTCQHAHIGRQACGSLEHRDSEQRAQAQCQHQLATRRQSLPLDSSQKQNYNKKNG
jgi:hypothetical protein